MRLLLFAASGKSNKKNINCLHFQALNKAMIRVCVCVCVCVCVALSPLQESMQVSSQPSNQRKQSNESACFWET